jgi:hypothetical protein
MAREKAFSASPRSSSAIRLLRIFQRRLTDSAHQITLDREAQIGWFDTVLF